MLLRADWSVQNNIIELQLFPDEVVKIIMSVAKKVAAISTVVLGGGGLWFYFRETYLAEKKQKRCEELERELNELTKTRQDKEKQLDTRSRDLSPNKN